MSDNKVERDAGNVVRFLVSTFNKATAHMERPAVRRKGVPNELYRVQTEFAYLLNEVMQCPASIVQFHIAQCNAYIDEILMQQNDSQTN